MLSQPHLRLDLASPVPAYRQIVDQIRTLLVEQVLKPGESLPSVRRVALDLGIHFNTVAEAYRKLSEEGWLEVAHGKSVRVRERISPPPPGQEVIEVFRLRLRQLVAEMQSQGLPVMGIARELFTLAKGIQS